MGSSAVEAVTQGYALGETIRSAPIRRQTQELELQKLGMEVSNIQDTLERKNEARKLYQMAVKPGATLEERGKAYADAMSAAGFIEEGFDALTKISGLQVDQHNIAEDDRKAKEEAFAVVSETFANVKSKEDYDARWDMIAMSNPELMKQPGVQELRDAEDWQEASKFLVDRAISMKDESEIEARRAQADAARASAAKDRYEMEHVMPERARAEAARADNLKKVGATDKRYKDLVKYTTDAILARFPPRGSGSKDQAQARVLGRQGAALAESYMEDGMPPDEAIEQAITDMDSEGLFAGMRPARPGSGSRSSPVTIKSFRETASYTSSTWVSGKDSVEKFFVRVRDGERKVFTEQEFDDGLHLKD